MTLAPGEVRNVDFHLVVQAIMAEPFDVAAERALVEVERTGSAHFLSSRQMESMPLDQVVDMVAQQPGVTLQDNEIHIRGGRADDTSFIVDGMNVSDPLAGGGYGYQIDASVINEIEVLTGGFNAEYGQAVSGVVKVSTKEGSDEVEGKVSFKRDYLHPSTSLPGSGKTVKSDPRDWRDLTDYTESDNIDIIKASLSGPDPIGALLRKLGIGLPGKQYFLLSGSADLRDGYLPIYSRQENLVSPVYSQSFWSPREDNNWNGMAKWTWHINPDNKLNINLSRQVGISQGFDLPGEGYPRPVHRQHGELPGLHQRRTILTNVFWRQVLSGHRRGTRSPSAATSIADAQQPQRQRRFLDSYSRRSRKIPTTNDRVRPGRTSTMPTAGTITTRRAGRPRAPIRSCTRTSTSSRPASTCRSPRCS